MKVGTVRPELRPDWMKKNLAWKILAGLEYLAAWPFYAFHTLALFRLTIELGAIAALIFTVFGVYGEFQEREKDRAVRIATMFVQIAQTMALPEGKGLKAVKPSVELLAGEAVPMLGINLKGADLFSADLRGADFRGANLSGANLDHVNLSGANLGGANLGGTISIHLNLSDADLSNADLSNAFLLNVNLGGADLIGADLSSAHITNVDFSEANSAQRLSQDQLDEACADPSNPPQLPASLTWNGPPCD
ncbi:MAG: pentapeptide repeat-containing protein [Rhodobacteraceae bacterium]|nr:pentapeptide repeat-containing protein [Paracoccaceae bacterium]